MTSHLRHLALRSAARAAISLTMTNLVSGPALAHQVVVDAAPLSRAAVDHGRANPSTQMDVTVWLRLHEEQEFHNRVLKLYDPAAPSYHKWLNEADLSRYAPKEAEREAIERVMGDYGLTVLRADARFYSVTFRGSVSAVGGAFNTEIHNFVLNGQAFHANVRSASVEGPSSDLVTSVVGLENTPRHNYARSLIDPRTAAVALGLRCLPVFRPA